MSNALKFCGCQNCRRGMRGRFGHRIVRAAKRKFRQDARRAIKQGREPDRLASVPYTD